MECFYVETKSPDSEPIADGIVRQVKKPAETLAPLRPEPPFPMSPNERAARAAVVDQRDGPVLVLECSKCKHVSRLTADYQLPPETTTLTSPCSWCGSGRVITLHRLLQLGDRVIAPASALGVADRHKTLVRLRCDECHSETEARIEPGAIAQRIAYCCETCWPGSPIDKTTHTVTVITSKLMERFNDHR
jgi:hypothetical protein